MTIPEDIRAWRKAERARLLALREALVLAERREARERVTATLEAEVPELAGATVGFYWPFRAEMELVGFVRRLVEQGGRAALPVVVEKRHPLEFWRWEPGMEMRPGIWNIPTPATAEPVRPDCLLVPLVGFDDAGYRLGYGGGYYDRTLAIMEPRPLTIGIGHGFQHLPTIHPQPDDIPLDAIVTERGITWHRRPPRRSTRTPVAPPGEDPNAEPVECSSPPCFMHELGEL
jgi:5-formyltetrahydrofolate cyclo-ligase